MCRMVPGFSPWSWARSGTKGARHQVPFFRSRSLPGSSPAGAVGPAGVPGDQDALIADGQQAGVGRVGLNPRRRIMRSTATCIMRASCTTTTEPCRRWPLSALVAQMRSVHEPVHGRGARSLNPATVRNIVSSARPMSSLKERGRVKGGFAVLSGFPDGYGHAGLARGRPRGLGVPCFPASGRHGDIEGLAAAAVSTNSTPCATRTLLIMNLMRAVRRSP